MKGLDRSRPGPTLREGKIAAALIFGGCLVIALAVEFGPALLRWLLDAPADGYRLLSYAGLALAAGAFGVLLALAFIRIKRRGMSS